MSQILRLGTRRSLLAMAQSRYVKNEIEKLYPGLKVELIGIETQGDKLLDIALQKVQGKDFFVAEIDKELLEKKIDLAVHSFKDLSLERPEELIVAAIPRREYAHDVVFFHPRVKEKLTKGDEIFIGSSSPRRKKTIPPFLENSLPKLSNKKPKITFLDLRGNVNTRLLRLFQEKNGVLLDGVVLALAGMNRLFADLEGKKYLQEIFLREEILFQILPLSEVPTSPAQGALAVVCRKEDKFTYEIIRKLHDPKTEKAVQKERALLEKYGGGCHQAFGVSYLYHQELGPLYIARGLSTHGENLAILEQEDIYNIKMNHANKKVFFGTDFLKSEREVFSLNLSNEDLQKINKAESIFISHRHAITQEILPFLEQKKLYVAGTKTWFSAAERGLWVCGSADSLGFSYLKELLENSPIFNSKDILILTHEEAAKRRPNSIVTYQSQRGNLLPEVAEADIVYWASASQFLANREKVKPSAIHCCGAGETAVVLKEHGIKPLVFYNQEIFKKWLTEYGN